MFKDRLGGKGEEKGASRYCSCFAQIMLQSRQPLGLHIQQNRDVRGKKNEQEKEGTVPLFK